MLHFEKSSKMAKIWQKMKKSLVGLAFNHAFNLLFSWFQVPENQISGTHSDTNTHITVGCKYKAKCNLLKMVPIKYFFTKTTEWVVLKFTYLFLNIFIMQLFFHFQHTVIHTHIHSHSGPSPARCRCYRENYKQAFF